jgi:light-regulated signal transduction histidine kinase (bacteriophytochrome)
VGAFLDITGLIRAEDEITNLNRDLQQNVQELRVTNKELEAFIYSVSHDLRAPLRSIKGFSDFLLHDYQASLDDRGRQYLDRVIKNTIKMDRLIDDLLHLSRISRQQLERVEIDLSRIVSELAVELRNACPERQVSLDIEEGLCAKADPRLIRLALANLLNNAWKFTLKTDAPRIAFGLLKKDGMNAYFLRDNGAGFDHNYADKLFLPFHRLHSEQEFEGSGIGLAIVERVVRRHGGRVWAEGRLNEGAVFYFTLHD